MNCLSLNIQGAGSGDKKFWVRGLCNLYRVSFLGIQETKMTEMDLVTVRSLWEMYVSNMLSQMLGGFLGVSLLFGTLTFSVGRG